MNILLIKQTSLGDVLHATPHLRAIKQKYPDAHLTVLTATGSAEIYAHNPFIDRLILFDYPRFKQIGLSSPRALVALFKQTQMQINQREYALAFDLQGLVRSVVFLYFARANKKYAKGNWLGLGGFRNKQLHAIDEMTQVLAQAEVPVTDVSMMFARSADSTAMLQTKLAANGLDSLLDDKKRQKIVVISPFTRWAAKNWPIKQFIETASQLSEHAVVLITGTAQDKLAIEHTLNEKVTTKPIIVNMAGELNLTELAELMSQASLVISGDSFPMHLATAVGTPLIALFGPTDERKTGPRSNNSEVLRPRDCQRCDNPNCKRACLERIPVVTVIQAAKGLLANT